MNDPYVNRSGRDLQRALRWLFLRTYLRRFATQIALPGVLIGVGLYAAKVMIGVDDPTGEEFVSTLNGALFVVATVRWWRLERKRIEHNMTIALINRWHRRNGDDD